MQAMSGRAHHTAHSRNVAAGETPAASSLLHAAVVSSLFVLPSAHRGRTRAAPRNRGQNPGAPPAGKQQKEKAHQHTKARFRGKRRYGSKGSATVARGVSLPAISLPPRAPASSSGGRGRAPRGPRPRTRGGPAPPGRARGPVCADTGAETGCGYPSVSVGWVGVGAAPSDAHAQSAGGTQDRAGGTPLR